MPNSWGRPPRNEIWQDLQALAIWIVIIAVVGYLLFPGFFKDVFGRISTPVTETSDLGEVALPDANSGLLDSTYLPSQYYPDSYNALYNGQSEVSSGYWVIFVSQGGFMQLPLNTDGYAFILNLIKNDQTEISKNTVILTANGQLQKYIISDEVYLIIQNMAIIEGRKSNIYNG